MTNQKQEPARSTRPAPNETNNDNHPQTTTTRVRSQPPNIDLLRRWLATLQGVPGHVIASTWPTFKGATVNLADTDKAAANLAEHASQTDVYLRATTTQHPVNGRGRGAAQDTAAVFALWADLDHAEGCHSPNPDGLPLPPDPASALKIIEALPEPSLVVDSSGGFQPWWLLTEPVTVTDDVKDIVERWGELMVTLGAKHGWHVDNVGDLARILRPPGTLNHKWTRHGQAPRPVTVHESTGARYTLDELALWLPEKATPPAAPATTSDHGDIEAWETATDWAQILEPAGWRLHRTHNDGTREWTRPGEPDHPRSAVTDFAGVPTIVVHSSNAPLPSGAGQRLTKFRTFAELRHGGDTTAASTEIRERFGKPITPTTVLRGTSPLLLPGTSPLLLPGDFWGERHELAWIRQAAHSRNRSPDAVLHAILARVAAHVPHHYRLPPIVGTDVGLTYIAALVSQSGEGKSSAKGIANKLLNIENGPDIADNLTVGSGEGLIQALYGKIPNPDDPGKKIPAQTKNGGYVYIDEGQALAAIAQRSGATLLSVLREIWMGGTVGQTNANEDRNRRLEEGTYTYGVLIGIQKDHAGPLLDDVAAGTPQRFGWASAIDPATGHGNWPGQLPWSPPRLPEIIGAGGTFLDVHPDIATEIRDRDRAKQQGRPPFPDPLDGHRDLLREKVAALLALLNSRTNIDLEDWQLAGVAIETSVAVRSNVLAVLAETAERDRNRKARHRGASNVVAANVEETATVQRCAEAIRRLVTKHGGESTHKKVKASLTQKNRDLVEDGIDVAVSEGWITVVAEAGQGSSKRVLRAVQDA